MDLEPELRKVGGLVLDTYAEALATAKKFLPLPQHRRSFWCDEHFACIYKSPLSLLEVYEKQILSPDSEEAVRENVVEEIIRFVKQITNHELRMMFDSWAVPHGLVPVQKLRHHIIEFLRKYVQGCDAVWQVRKRSSVATVWQVARTFLQHGYENASGGWQVSSRNHVEEVKDWCSWSSTTFAQLLDNLERRDSRFFNSSLVYTKCTKERHNRKMYRRWVMYENSETSRKWVKEVLEWILN